MFKLPQARHKHTQGMRWLAQVVTGSGEKTRFGTIGIFSQRHGRMQFGLAALARTDVVQRQMDRRFTIVGDRRRLQFDIDHRSVHPEKLLLCPGRCAVLIKMLLPHARYRPVVSRDSLYDRCAHQFLCILCTKQLDGGGIDIQKALAPVNRNRLRRPMDQRSVVRLAGAQFLRGNPLLDGDAGQANPLL